MGSGSFHVIHLYERYCEIIRFLANAGWKNAPKHGEEEQ